MHGNAYQYDANVKHMNSAGVLATLRNHEYYMSRVPQLVLRALKKEWGLSSTEITLKPSVQACKNLLSENAI